MHSGHSLDKDIWFVVSFCLREGLKYLSLASNLQYSRWPCIPASIPQVLGFQVSPLMPNLGSIFKASSHSSGRLGVTFRTRTRRYNNGVIHSFLGFTRLQGGLGGNHLTFLLAWLAYHHGQGRMRRCMETSVCAGWGLAVSTTDPKCGKGKLLSTEQIGAS